MKRDEDGGIVGAVDLFYWPPGAGVAEYIRTIYDVPKVDRRPQITLEDDDPTDGKYSVFPSYGPENVVLPTLRREEAQ
jgi:hypothetical protein